MGGAGSRSASHMPKTWEHATLRIASITRTAISLLFLEAKNFYDSHANAISQQAENFTAP